MFYILWDEAHLWGVLMLRALGAWGLPARLIRSREVAAGILTDAAPAVFVVPGGFASRKAMSLTPAGLAGVRDYVRSGGAYLGVCGGAGLGLTVPGGLGLCPWTREPFAHRLQHFASGTVELVPRPSAFTPKDISRPTAPIWWPAKFRPGDPGVETVAAYGPKNPDFMMADIPLSLVPQDALEDWETLYGVRLAPAFDAGDPCIVAGRFGKGRYVLSHAHLETPGSPEANAWLGYILAELAGISLAPTLAAPAWNIGQGDPAFDNPALKKSMERMLQLVALGQAHGLLDWREPWLLGWRQGLPGAALSGILAMLDCALAMAPTDASRRFFERKQSEFVRNMDLLAKGLSGYLLAERLALTLSRVDPEAVPERGLREAKLTLFGPPPGAGGLSGGLCGAVLSILEEYIFLTGREGLAALTSPRA